jgi:hypothetical protein
LGVGGLSLPRHKKQPHRPWRVEEREESEVSAWVTSTWRDRVDAVGAARALEPTPRRARAVREWRGVCEQRPAGQQRRRDKARTRRELTQGGSRVLAHNVVGGSRAAWGQRLAVADRGQAKANPARPA